MEGLRVYKKMPVWNKQTLPLAFQKKHNTALGTWARLTILSGELKYESLNANGDVLVSYVFSPSNPPPLVEPQDWHRVEPLSDNLECFLEFLCEPEMFYTKKYKLSEPHSEIKEVTKYLNKGEALDLGCGRGRNSLFLQSKGYKVKAIDKDEKSIKVLEGIVEKEGLGSDITVEMSDLEHLQIDGNYDLILSTVVLQFLKPNVVNTVIQSMKNHTKVGGYNLIVCPMSTDKHSCPLNLPFTFAAEELRSHYKGWNIKKYNEDLGHFHRKDEAGNFYKSQFATLLAQKTDDN